MVILKPPEIRTILDKAATQKDKVLLITAVLTGAREGELIGLQWGDVDWLNSQLHIRRSFNRGKFMEPKSNASRRKIDLARELVQRIEEVEIRPSSGREGFCVTDQRWTDIPTSQKKPTPRVRPNLLR